MKKIQYILMGLAALATAASCMPNKLEEPLPLQKDGQEVVFTAFAPGQDTKTTVAESGPDILWSNGDQINVFFAPGRSWNPFTTELEAPSAKASFKGPLTGFTGSFEGPGSGSGFWAVYPYNYNNSRSDDGKSVITMVPFVQTGKEGSFDPAALVSVAYSKDLQLGFYNICGGLKFSLSRPGIQQIEFRSNSGSVLAGSVVVEMDGDGFPVIAETVAGTEESMVLLTAPYEEAFETGKWYYLTCLPGVLEQGWTLTFRSETETGVLEHLAQAEVKRSVWGVLENADAGVTEWKNENNMIWCNEIWYTTTDNATITPNNISRFDYDNGSAVLVENTMDDAGRGVLRFNKAVTCIPSSSFRQLPTLKTISLPVSVRIIGGSAFARSEALEEVNLREGVLEIGPSVFYGTNVQSIFVPASVKSIPYGFSQTKISSLTGPLVTADGLCVVSTEGTLMATAPALSKGEYTIPAGVNAIGPNAFYQDSTLTAVTIPGSVQKIDDYAFSYCWRLKDVVVEEGLVAIGNYAFSSCYEAKDGVVVNGLETVSLPGSLEEFGENVFYYCRNLKRFSGPWAYSEGHLLIKDGTTILAATANLEEVTIPGTVTSIADMAFWGNPSLKKVEISEGVQTIGNAAFGSCNALEEVSFPASVVSIGRNPFQSCTSLQRFTGAGAYTDGRIIERNGILYAYAPASGTEYTIPSTITQIGDNAFFLCQNLRSVTLNEGVRSIGDSAFNNSGITFIEIPSSVTNIGVSAFYGFQIQRVKFLGSTPPVLRGNPFWQSAFIYVPRTAFESYYNAASWSAYQANITFAPIKASCADIIAGQDGTNYTVTGICASIVNTNYGNWYLKDDTGEIYIYGTVDGYGNYNWSAVNIKEGDIVTVEGPKTTYNGVTELVDVKVVKVEGSKLDGSMTTEGVGVENWN